ncbi:hypothetical protein [Sutterella sp.]|uniref:hypothetical protein n=1 Tax=Sutterella sp. TaxID=1981025 RepID=UPI0026DF387D|nr:hypothetical protein [Sutterella sp.]MDO5531804.1 hypothetical protein [Sutterella sp.]
MKPQLIPLIPLPRLAGSAPKFPFEPVLKGDDVHHKMDLPRYLLGGMLDPASIRHVPDPDAPPMERKTHCVNDLPHWISWEACWRAEDLEIHVGWSRADGWRLSSVWLGRRTEYTGLSRDPDFRKVLSHGCFDLMKGFDVTPADKHYITIPNEDRPDLVYPDGILMDLVIPVPAGKLREVTELWKRFPKITAARDVVAVMILTRGLHRVQEAGRSAEERRAAGMKVLRETGLPVWRKPADDGCHFDVPVQCYVMRVFTPVHLIPAILRHLRPALSTDPAFLPFSCPRDSVENYPQLGLENRLGMTLWIMEGDWRDHKRIPETREQCAEITQAALAAIEELQSPPGSDPAQASPVMEEVAPEELPEEDVVIDEEGGMDETDTGKGGAAAEDEDQKDGAEDEDDEETSEPPYEDDKIEVVPDDPNIMRILADDQRAFFADVIMNPFGPTVNFLTASAREMVPGGTAKVWFVWIHPSQAEYAQVGTIRFPKDWDGSWTGWDVEPLAETLGELTVGTAVPGGWLPHEAQRALMQAVYERKNGSAAALAIIERFPEEYMRRFDAEMGKVEVPLPDLTPIEVLARWIALSLDPVFRSREYRHLTHCWEGAEHYIYRGSCFCPTGLMRYITENLLGAPLYECPAPPDA